MSHLTTKELTLRYDESKPQLPVLMTCVLPLVGTKCTDQTTYIAYLGYWDRFRVLTLETNYLVIK